MAFPQVAGTNTSSQDTTGTSHTVNLPASIEAGDLLFVVFGSAGTFATVTFPNGWNEGANSGANNISGRWGWRFADGTEASTITVTTSSSQTSAHFTYRITGHGGPFYPPQGGGFWNTGTDAAPNSPNRTPTGGAKDYLWLTCVAADSGFVCTAAPTNYTDLQTSDGGSQANISTAVSVARRELNAASEDPGAFTLEGAEGWLAATIAIHPAGQANPISIKTGPDRRPGN